MRHLFFFCIALFSVFSSMAQQQRLVVFGGSAWFPFDPLTGRYQNCSLAQVASYVDAWREELGDESFFVAMADNFSQKMPDGYKAFMALGDSSVLEGVRSYFGIDNGDLSKFEINKYSSDTLSAGNILVIDRWNYFGDITVESKIANVAEYPVSARYMKAQDRAVEILRHKMSSPVRVLDTIFSTKDQYFGPSVLSGLFHRFQMLKTDAQLSLCAISRPDMEWQAGDLYAKDIYRMLVYDNQLAVVEVSGNLLLEYLEKIYGSRYRTMRSANDDLLQGKLPYFYHESLAGAVYWVNISKTAGRRIENSDIDLTKMYKVATTSFGTKWFADKGCKITMQGEYRLEFLKWLQSADLSGLDRVEQWRIVPEKWAAQAVEREKKK